MNNSELEMSFSRSRRNSGVGPPPSAAPSLQPSTSTKVTSILRSAQNCGPISYFTVVKWESELTVVTLISFPRILCHE